MSALPSGRPSRALALLAPLLLGACVSMPSGPSISSLPGTGRNFDQFRTDESACRRYATDAIAGSSPAQAQANSALTSAAVGTAIGALAGAALGGSQGASTGAGVGLLFGGVAGAGAANSSGHALQQRYDNAYVQCMYAKGHKVPVSGGVHANPPRPTPSAAPGAVRAHAPYPPPPPGYRHPPPPPPGYGAPPR